MKKHIAVLRIAMTALVLSLFAMATYITYTNGTLPDAVYNTMNSGQQDRAKATVRKSEAEHPFRIPAITDTKNVFMHSTIPHTNKDSITTETATTKDDRGRISTISYRMTPENAILYSKEPNNWKSALIIHELTKDNTELTFSGQVWDNDIQPYLNAMYAFVSKNDTPINVIWTLSYTDKNDKYPAYAQLEAYTIHSDDVNFRVSFANTSSNGPIDYATGELYTGKVGSK